MIQSEHKWKSESRNFISFTDTVIKWFFHFVLVFKIEEMELLILIKRKKKTPLNSNCHYCHCCCLVDKLCLTLCNLMDWARILEWVAISFSKGSSPPRDRTYIPRNGMQILYYWAIWEDQLPLFHILNKTYHLKQTSVSHNISLNVLFR